MFHHPDWAVASYSTGPPAGELSKSKSTQPSPPGGEIPCTVPRDLEQSGDLLQVDVLTKKHFGRKFFCEASNGGVPATAAWANVTVEMRRKFKRPLHSLTPYFLLLPFPIVKRPGSLLLADGSIGQLTAPPQPNILCPSSRVPSPRRRRPI